MELDELKNTWLALDQRLKQAESLNDRIVREMLYTKGDKALRRLSNFEWLGTIATFIALPVPFLLLGKGMTPIQNVLIVIFLFILFVAVFCQIWKIWILNRIDFSKSVSENIKLVQKFNIQIKREKLLNFSTLPLLFLHIFESLRIKSEITLEQIVLVVSVLAVTIVVCIWQYKKFYGKNIKSILKSLDELKELNEEK